jgi:hypothetical protein
VQTFELAFGRAHVFYSEATETPCMPALLLDVNPTGPVRGRQSPADERFALRLYVGARADRPRGRSCRLAV